VTKTTARMSGKAAVSVERATLAVASVARSASVGYAGTMGGEERNRNLIP
jgi:hypothetical protein